MTNIDKGCSRPILIFLVLFSVICPVRTADAQKCLFVSSYHKGYAWSDGVERGLRSTLADKCDLKQLDMDTKRKKGKEHLEQAALAVKKEIETWKPDVVITADDIAAKHVIQKYFKDADVPFVFCGVNWTAKEYGFPYPNVTGMVEVAPIRPMLRRAARIALPGVRTFYLGADTLTEGKNRKRFSDASADLGIEFGSTLASSTDEWLAVYEEAQGYDFLILGSNSGINDWDSDRVKKALPGLSKRLTITSHSWMMPYTMLGMTKVAEEQGEWSGATALAILGGIRPADIPITTNRRWNIWANDGLLKAAAIELPGALRRKAKSVE